MASTGAILIAFRSLLTSRLVEGEYHHCSKGLKVEKDDRLFDQDNGHTLWGKFGLMLKARCLVQEC